MNDYINRRGTLFAIGTIIAGCRAKVKRKEISDAEALTVMSQAITEFIESAKAADVAPVMHGEWIDFFGDGTNAVCSICGHRFEVSWITKTPLADTMQKAMFRDFQMSHRFCHHCGAKMDGGKNHAK